jgi:hypothetical protein
MSNETDHLEGFWGRINHPVFGVFASAWLVINWELVYTLIRGLTDVPATITQINTVYLAPARYGFLIWKPIVITLIFLVLAPILRKSYELWKELVEIGRDWLSKKMNKLSPVTRFEFENKDSQFKQVKMELEVLKQVLQLVDPQLKSANVADPNNLTPGSTMRMELTQLISIYNGLVGRNRELAIQNKELTLRAQREQQQKDNSYSAILQLKMENDELKARLLSQAPKT